MKRISTVSAVMLIAGAGFLSACSDSSGPEQPAATATSGQTVKSEAAVHEPAQHLYEQAVAYARHDDYARAADLFRQAAEQGNRHAQYQLGLLYARGTGVKQDFREARNWLYKAAMAGHPKAQYHLGEMYARGDGVPEDHAEALVWFWLGTTMGDRYAETRLRAMAPRVKPEEMAAAKQRSEALWKQMPHDMKVNRFSMH